MVLLNLIKSNRMEYLVEALCAVISRVLEDPMAPEVIGIQSRGMKQWLTTAIAAHFGICANVRFAFPREILELALGTPDDGDKAVLNREIMTWAVMDMLMAVSSGQDLFNGAGPANYINNDATGRKALQLSRKIAGVFDDYQVYRPDMLAAWEGRGRAAGPPAPHVEWQTGIWKKLVRKGVPLSERLDAFLAGKTAAGYLPERVSLFGVSAMPPRFLDAFHALARTAEINLFLLTPSSQFFFDLKSRQAREREALAGLSLSGTQEVDLTSGDEELFPAPDDDTNPLLAALGKSGREFHSILENFDYHEPFGDVFAEPAPGLSGEPGDDPDSRVSPPVLAVLQSDILNLVNRRAGGPYPPIPADPRDRSIAVHACHSPMREAQVLKDLLLDAFNTSPDLAPHDIIVMMPDIESYAPFLEAVFSQEPRIPYTVSDRRKRSESKTLDAFLKILKLEETRLEKSEVMDLLLCPVIAAKFGLSLEELALVDEAFDASGVLWGRDKSHRREIMGRGYDENTWAFGIRRLVTGYAVPGGEDALVGNVLPSDGFEGLDADVLGRAVHFLSTLFRHLKKLTTEQTPEAWGLCLKQMVRAMMAEDASSEADIGFLLTAIDEMGTHADTAGFDRELGFPVIRDIIRDILDRRISQGSFLAGSLTFCNLMPMRSIPFKIVCLMGMDEKGFPRGGGAPGFDLVRAHPRAGDKQEREEDCYLFLESLLSARERFIITYTGMRISDNSPVPCAGPVAELLDAVTAGFVFTGGHGPVVTHPLHPFSPAYFDPSVSGLFSYSKPQCRIARAQEDRKTGRSEETGPFIGTISPVFPEPDTATDAPAVIDIQELIRFFRHPVQAFVTHTLGLTYGEPRSWSEDREPFQVSGLAQYHLGTISMDRACEPGIYERIRAGGLLPLGRKGRMEWERIQGLAAPVNRLANERIPDETPGILRIDPDMDLGTGPYRFRGQVGELFSTGRFVKGFGTLTPVRLLTQWVYHLLYTLGGSDRKETWILGRGAGKSKGADALGFTGDFKGAKDMLHTLARLYWHGREQVVPFLPVPCFHLAQSLVAGGSDPSGDALAKAMAKARPYWTGNAYMPGECRNRYTALAFGDQDPFSGADALAGSGLLDTGLAVFTPLLENLAR